MEFSDFITKPTIQNVTLKRPFKETLTGTLCITSHHFIHSTHCNHGDQDEAANKELCVLHTSIDSLVKKSSEPYGSLMLHCKNFSFIQLDFATADDCSAAADSIKNLSNVSEPTSKYPFFYHPPFEVMENGWLSFRPECEFARLSECSDEWRLSFVNKDFSICQSYPQAIVVPKFIEDESLYKIATFRHGGRIPVLSYYHKETKSVLMRCGQPLIGPTNKRCREDEKCLSSIVGVTRRGYIIDTRSAQLAKMAQAKGGGVENSSHYYQWRCIHQPLERRNTMHDSLVKLIEAVNDTTSSTEKWLSKLESSNWLSMVKDILTCSCIVAQSIDKESASVLVHGSEGSDTTLQVTSLAQVILDHDCRTVTGFEALVDREWLQAGHPFELRCSRSAFAVTNEREEAPVFLLFLDCVWQMMQQFPCSFEFNEKFLITLFDHSYSSSFGTFLCNNECERQALKLSTHTVSIWSYINRPEIIQQYLNPLYDVNASVIWPSVAPQSLKLWRSLYQSSTLDPGPRVEANEEISKICSTNKKLRSQVMRLRRQVTLLQREALAANVIMPAGLDIGDCSESF